MKNTDKSKRVDRPKLSTRKKAIFAAAIPISFFAVAIILNYSVFAYLNRFNTLPSRQVSDIFCIPSDYGWELTPNLDTPIKTNSLGYRESYEIPFEKKANEIRVFAGNDSIQFGAEVSKEDAICDLAENLLTETFREEGIDKEWEFINASVPCWGHYQTLWRIQREGKKFNPDLFMLSACQNDPGDDFMIYSAEKNEDPKIREKARTLLLGGASPVSKNPMLRKIHETRNWLNSNTNIFGYFYWRNVLKQGADNPDWYREMWKTLGTEGTYDTVMIPIYLDVFSQLNEETKGKNFVVIYPAHNYVGHVLGGKPGKDFMLSPDSPVERELPFRIATLEFVEKNNIPYIDALQIYLGYLKENPDVHWEELFAIKMNPTSGKPMPDKIHPSGLGHRLVTEMLPDFLRKNFPHLFY